MSDRPSRVSLFDDDYTEWKRRLLRLIRSHYNRKVHPNLWKMLADDAVRDSLESYETYVADPWKESERVHLSHVRWHDAHSTIGFPVEDDAGKIVVWMSVPPFQTPLSKELAEPSPSPPANSELTLRFLLSRKNRQAILGDLTEEYAEICQQHSLVWARAWYYFQAVREIVRAVLIRIAALSGLAAALEAYRRFISN